MDQIFQQWGFMHRWKMNKLDIIGICLAIGYLFACYIFTGFQVYGPWNIILLSICAFPFSFLSLWVAYDIGGGPILFITMNTIWWYLLPKLFYYPIRFVVRKIKNLKNHSSWAYRRDGVAGWVEPKATFVIMITDKNFPALLRIEANAWLVVIDLSLNSNKFTIYHPINSNIIYRNALES